MDLLEFVTGIQRDIWNWPIYECGKVRTVGRASDTLSTLTSIALLKTKSDQGVSAAGQQHLVCVRFVEGAPLNANGGEVQWKGGKGIENEMFRSEVGQRQCTTKIWSDFWGVRNGVDCAGTRVEVRDFQVLDFWKEGKEIEEDRWVQRAKSQT